MVMGESGTNHMLIYIDGAQNSGVTALSKKVLEGFDPTMSAMHTSVYPDKLDGLGFLERFNHALNSVDVHVFNRGWVTESLRGSLEGNLGWLSSNYFISEWIYGRPLIDRGGRCILVPSDKHACASRKTKQTNYNAFEEQGAFEQYAKHWFYEIKPNDYTGRSLNNNATSLRSKITKVHRWDTEDYVGSTNPELIFVGEAFELLGVKMPFLDLNSLKYFEPFGARAINNFAYTTIGHVSNLPDRLQRRCIMVGFAAKYYFPEFRSVPSVLRNHTPETQNAFTKKVKQHLTEMKKD